MDVALEKGPGISLETRRDRVECLVCSTDAAADCQELAQAFATHFSGDGAVYAGESLLRRINRVHEWVVCEGCQARLSGEDRVRLMSLWVVIEGLRNWLRTEMHLGRKGALPSPPPVQLA